VATRDVVGERMAGPGIRAWHFTQELQKHFPTALVAKGMSRAPLREASVLIGQPARAFRRFRRGQRLVFDLFDPVLLELRELYGKFPTARERVHVLAEWWRLRRALSTGDLFVCATPKQRELYPSVAGRVIEVPFGAEQDVPRTDARDNTVVWGGGTWEWLDPETAVSAVVRLNQRGTRCRLLFLGRSRPNRAKEDRTDALLEAGRPFVEANDDWVPYRKRFETLSKCKVAIMLHRDTPEAKYSIRTRMFDAIAAAVPVVATAGGFAAELVEREGLGIVVAPGDAGGVADAIHKLLTDDDFYAGCVSALERVRPAFSWSIVTRPLVEALNEWKHQS
jgi:glycosyltransferase involved in cell wall biosynthesis